MIGASPEHSGREPTEESGPLDLHVQGAGCRPRARSFWPALCRSLLHRTGHRPRAAPEAPAPQDPHDRPSSGSPHGSSDRGARADRGRLDNHPVV